MTQALVQENDIICFPLMNTSCCTLTKIHCLIGLLLLYKRWKEFMVIVGKDRSGSGDEEFSSWETLLFTDYSTLFLISVPYYDFLKLFPKVFPVQNGFWMFALENWLQIEYISQQACSHRTDRIWQSLWARLGLISAVWVRGFFHLFPS